MIIQAQCYLAIRSLKKDWGKANVDIYINEVFELDELTEDERKLWDKLVKHIKKDRSFLPIIASIAKGIKEALAFLTTP